MQTRRNKSWWKCRVVWAFIFLVALLYWAWLPSVLLDEPKSTVLYASRGELLAAKIASDGQWRFPASDSIPERFKECLLHFEDEYFYWHPGFNPVSLFRSARQNIQENLIRSGGSTITMQLARMLRNNQSRNYYQKFVELLLAIRIELSYKKSSILNLYCAAAPFGSNVVGLEAASWRYFGRSPQHLSWAEAATLAVLPNAPSLIYPGKNQQRLLEKRNRLLKKLCDKKKIDQQTYQLSIQEPLPGKPHPIPQLAPHLLDRCISENKVSQTFYSTIHKEYQSRITDLLNRHIQHLSGNQIYNACAILAETQTGRVLAYVGNSASPGNLHENYVDVIRAPRSTGSILKPFLYAFMLNENKLLPAALVEDVPMRIGAYGPKNYNLTYDGLVPANQAIARSLNVPAVKMLQTYGTAKFHRRLAELGFTSFNKPTTHYGLSLILGGGEASLWEIASAYASMGRSLNAYSDARKKYLAGVFRPLTYLENKSTEKKRLFSNAGLLKASSMYYTFKAMTELLRPQDYIGWKQFLSKNQIAWKTGTSFGFRDAWAVGLDAKYTVAVWVGNADGEGRPDLTGNAAAAPLMFSIFNLLGERQWFSRPENDLEEIRVCRQSGYKASEICPDPALKNYPYGASRTEPCPLHQLLHLDESGQFRVNSDCYPVDKMQHKAWFVLSPVQEYFYRQHQLDHLPPPPFLASCNISSTQQMEIVYPREGFQVYIPVDESGQQGRCILKATHKNAAAVLYWYLDGNFAGSTERYHQLSLIPGNGQHLLEVIDQTGATVSCRFEVLGKQ